MTNGIRRPFAVFSIVVAFLGGFALVYSFSTVPPQLSAEFAVLLSAALLAENFPVMMGAYRFSIGYPIVVAAAVFCGPSEAVIVAVLSSVSLSDLRQMSPISILYNVGQIATSAASAAWTYVLLGGPVLAHAMVGGFRLSDFPQAITPLLALVIIGAMANVVLACIGISLKNDMPVLTVARSLGALPVGQIAFGLIGVLIAEVTAISVVALGLFAFPLVVARQFHVRYDAMRNAFTDTIRSLVSALEAKDTYTRGHSERVAELALMIGKQAGLDHKGMSELETAALLHDLGKLLLPGAILRKPGGLDPEEWALVKEHPFRGAEMVRRIPPLRHLADDVQNHHERLDGSGYPSGLRAGDIAEISRMLAVADCYDAMTSCRPYRPVVQPGDAIAELRSCKAQLDEHFVLLLADALGVPTKPDHLTVVPDSGTESGAA